MIRQQILLMRGAVVTAFFVFTCTAQADNTLWYNGDYDNVDAATNQVVPINTGSGFVFQTTLAFDDFVVPAGQVWTISSVFSNDQLSYAGTPTTATWQIRSGVSDGDGGTLVASGDTAASFNALTPVPGDFYADPETQVTAAVPGVTLTAGTYWLAVAPDSAGFFGDQSYVETTSGANAVGTPTGNDGNSFLTTNYPASGTGSMNFVAASSIMSYDDPPIDFSLGINGTYEVLPEPSSLVLVAVGAGVIGLSVLVRRRQQGDHRPS